MSRWMVRGVAGVAALVAGLTFAAPVWAETKPPTTPGGRNAPPPKGVKWEGPDFDAAKGRTPAKGKGFYTLPEVDDEVLVRSKRKGAN